MAPPIVYDGVNGKYEGTLFNGLKYWVSRRVPTRSLILDKIKDNGGKIVELEKHADILIADHIWKDCPPRSVSWKYINDCVAAGELVNIEDYYPVRQTRVPTKGNRVLFSKLDEQILVTWVKKAGFKTRGNEIYQELAKRVGWDRHQDQIVASVSHANAFQYPNHPWQSWRDKWVNKMSLLSEDQLPPVLPKLPPPHTQPSNKAQAAPDTSAPSARPTLPEPTAPTSPRSTPPRRGSNVRIRFTNEEDKMLVKYVAERIQMGKKPKGKEIYQKLEEKFPQHTWHSWRDRWIRYLSHRDPSEFSELEDEPAAESSRARTRPTISTPSLVGPPKARTAPAVSLPSVKTPAISPPSTTRRAMPPSTKRLSVPPSSTKTPTARLPHATRAAPPPSTRTPNIPPPSVRTPARPPPSEGRRNQTTPVIAPVESAINPMNGEPMTRLQELQYRGNMVKIVRAIQSPARGYILRSRLRTLQACVVALQPIAQGFLVRQACGLSPTGTQAEPRDERRVSTTEKGLSVVPQHDAELTEPEEAEDEPGQTDQHATPAGPRTTLVLSREDFWRTFNEYNELNCVLPGPWAQVDSLAVDFWDLWRCATGEPDHAFRNWEVVAEGLGFDWIAEPHVPVHLKVAFEKHLLGFEEALREFDQWDEGEEEEEGEGEMEKEVEDVIEEAVEDVGEGEVNEEEDDEGNEEEEEDGEGEDDEEVQEVHEKWVGVEEANDNETASQDSDANFVSSPPINLKRARVSSQTPFSSSVRKRPRYDPNVEVPETPQMRAEKAGQGVAGARAVVSNQHTPTRHPRYSVPSREPAEVEAHYSRPIPQYDGAEDEALLSPSQQLRSEIEATAFQREPARGTQSATSSANPTVLSDGDETSDSNSGFEAIDNLLVKPPPPRENRHRRTLSWSEGKGKQPATALTHTPQPPPRAHTTTTTTTTTTQPTPQPHPLSTPHTATPIRPRPHPPTATPTTPPDPGPVLNHYLAQKRCPPALIARAVRATTCDFHNTGLVLDSLLMGKGVPHDMRGVWTGRDDRVLKEVGVLGGGGRGTEGGLRGLVEKHGREGVVMRRAFLRGLDEA